MFRWETVEKVNCDGVSGFHGGGVHGGVVVHDGGSGGHVNNSRWSPTGLHFIDLFFYNDLKYLATY